MMKNVFSSHINMDWSKCEEHSASSSVPELSHLQNLQSIHMDPFIVIHGAGTNVDIYLNTQVSTYFHPHTYTSNFSKVYVSFSDERNEKCSTISSSFIGSGE